MTQFTILRNPANDKIGDNVEEFLKNLGGPGCVILDGKDNFRTRFYVTLLHGNEPSGVMALFRWLKQQRKPAVRFICVIASVETALQTPMFHYRNLPGVRDLNRCFHPPFDDKPGRLAKAILDLIHQYQPEAVIDVHNTSGSGPAFGVATHVDQKHEALTRLFSDKLIITHLKLGALMEISERFFPTVTIEVGGRLDEKAHITAWKGLEYYFTEKDILKLNKPESKVELLVEPIRFEIKKGVSLSYASTPNIEFDVIFRDDLDRLNFATVDTTTPLGWLNRGSIDNTFTIQDYKHRITASDCLQIKKNQIYLRQQAKLFMITTNPVIAIEDCIFYITKSDTK